MIDEQIRRRAAFQGTTSVRLADGQVWWLPDLSIDTRDPMLASLVHAVALGSDEPEALRDELALTMLLLSRNYRLTPDLYPRILGFQASDPGRLELQDQLRRIARSAPVSDRVDWVPNIDRSPRPARRWGIAAAASASLTRVRSRWSLRSH